LAFGEKNSVSHRYQALLGVIGWAGITLVVGMQDWYETGQYGEDRFGFLIFDWAESWRVVRELRVDWGS
jgi:hypothetical protein